MVKFRCWMRGMPKCNNSLSPARKCKDFRVTKTRQLHTRLGKIGRTQLKEQSHLLESWPERKEGRKEEGRKERRKQRKEVHVPMPADCAPITVLACRHTILSHFSTTMMSRLACICSIATDAILISPFISDIPSSLSANVMRRSL